MRKEEEEKWKIGKYKRNPFSSALTRHDYTLTWELNKEYQFQSQFEFPSKTKQTNNKSYIVLN